MESRTGVRRKCCRCHVVKNIDQFVGVKPGTITTTCWKCRKDIDGKKAQGDRLRTAMRELFMEGIPA